MKWMTKRFTFVVIPDANQSVKRYSVPALILILTLAVFILLGICSALFIVLNSGNAGQVQHLKNQLTASQSGFEEQLLSKDSEIAALEENLLALSAQAEQVENKVSEITELERQLKEIAGIEDSTVRISSGTAVTEGGQGGQEIELETSISSNAPLVSETMKSFSEMVSQIDTMLPSLESTIEAFVKYQHILDITPSIWPADSRNITSTFGVRSDPLTGRAALHSGLDLGGDRGDPIYAAADGVVTLSEQRYPYGNNIIIDHGRGIETRYLHLNKRLVEVGDTVKKGQLIGELGNTGRSTGPHLHYEVIINGENVDPMPYIKEDRKEP
jgi:murein DD-endopeptidase MepM/ murein hydrolase activator NlpD